MGRKPEFLHPYLLAHFRRTAAAFQARYPGAPVPVLTETHRSSEEQTALYAQGRNTPEEVNRLRKIAGLGPIAPAQNKVVTHAPAGKSLHNFSPALAYDIGFRTTDAGLDWSEQLFRQFAALARQDPLIEWGGEWPGTKRDMPHFQFKGMTWAKALAGVDPLRL